jgi:RNA polymerase-interacting CarD/CdnL/TRCF family regulator
MEFKIGDSVVHWNYGLGKVIAIEDKCMDGETRRYYCIEVGLLTLWVPFSENGDSPIRPLAGSDEFPALYEILQGQADELPEQQFLRKNALKERLQRHSLAETCRVIRDLHSRAKHTPLNQSESATLQRIESGLIDEWVLTLGIPRIEAAQALEELLKRS